MAQSVIGALRIDLALATAKFKEGAKKAQNMSRRLADRIKRHAKTIKMAFAAAAASVAAFAAGLAVAVRGSLKEFDKLAKLSRSIGVPVEQLSALQHAADLSGVSIDNLGKGFRNVARNAQAAARSPNDFSRSLDALGIKWREANGQFVQADQLMSAVADKFKGMQDGAGKTALAMKIFGERTGPQLVSMLNAGSDGIKEMTDEAEQLGLVVGTRAAVAAEKFNDNMARLGLQVTGFSNELTTRLLPAINHVLQGFVDWSKETGAAKASAEALANVVKGLIDIGFRVGHTFQVAGLRIRTAFEDAKSAVTGSWEEIIERNRIANARISKLQGDLAFDLREIWKETGKVINDAMSGNTGDGDAGGNALAEPPIVTSSKAETEALALRNQALAEGKRLMEELRTPQEVLIAEQQRINELMRVGAIDAETYGRAMRQATALSSKNMDALASSVSGALGQIFGESKGVAIAQALINTYQGITRAIATYPPPISTAMAAIQAAAGFAQVANIRKQTKKGGGGGGGGSSGGGSGAAAGASAAVPQQQQSFNINLPGENYSRDSVRGLIESLNEAMSDGAVLRVNPA